MKSSSIAYELMRASANSWLSFSLSPSSGMNERFPEEETSMAHHISLHGAKENVLYRDTHLNLYEESTDHHSQPTALLPTESVSSPLNSTCYRGSCPTLSFCFAHAPQANLGTFTSEMLDIARIRPPAPLCASNQEAIMENFVNSSTGPLAEWPPCKLFGQFAQAIQPHNLLSTGSRMVSDNGGVRCALADHYERQDFLQLNASITRHPRDMTMQDLSLTQKTDDEPKLEDFLGASAVPQYSHGGNESVYYPQSHVHATPGEIGCININSTPYAASSSLSPSSCKQVPTSIHFGGSLYQNTDNISHAKVFPVLRYYDERITSGKFLQLHGHQPVNPMPNAPRFPPSLHLETPFMDESLSTASPTQRHASRLRTALVDSAGMVSGRPEANSSVAINDGHADQDSHCSHSTTLASKKRQCNSKPGGSKPHVPRKSIDTFGQRTSQYRGVTRHRWTGRYEAHLWDNTCRKEGQTRKGRQVYLGGYDKEEKAASAYDLAALKYWGPTTHINFPLSVYDKELEEMKGMTRMAYVASLRRKSSGFSRGASAYRGVTRHHQQGRWQARIGRVAGNKDLYLGTFSTQEEAAEAYDIAAIKFRGIHAITNFDTSRYDVEHICSSSTLPVADLAKRHSSIRDKQVELEKASSEAESNVSSNQEGILSLQQAESTDIKDCSKGKGAVSEGLRAIEWSYMPTLPNHINGDTKQLKEKKLSFSDDDVSNKMDIDPYTERGGYTKRGGSSPSFDDVLSSHPFLEGLGKRPHHSTEEIVPNNTEFFLDQTVPNTYATNLPRANTGNPTSASLFEFEGSRKKKLVETSENGENSESEIDNKSPKESCDQLEIVLPGEFTKALNMVSNSEHHLPAAIFRSDSPLNITSWMAKNSKTHGARLMGSFPMFAVWNDT